MRMVVRMSATPLQNRRALYSHRSAAPTRALLAASAFACPARRSPCRIVAVQRAFHRNGHKPLNVFPSVIMAGDFADPSPWRTNMAYDRHDTRDAPRDERSRWSSDRYENRGGGGDRDERGFFERAGDEVASWCGDEDAERRRREDRMRDEREGGWSTQHR